MKPHNLRKLACRISMLAMLALSACSPSSSEAGPTVGNNPAVAAEESSETITRTAASGLDLQTTVLLNIYRQEAYQDNYPVEVPYQVEETYYEQVPYTEREAYTDYEEYYDNEYRCHTRYEEDCRYERECRQVPDRQCHQERVCRPGRPGREECQDVEECGTNARGERICKTRRVCRGGQPGPEECDYVERCNNNGTREECSQERRCRQVPREQCGYEQVRKTRPVTKYRDVTKYRQEQRTRTVTKHRTEYRCCVTKYRDVLDRQDPYKVTVQFPPTAILQANETETLQVKLLGGSNGQAVSAQIKEINTVYGYKVANQSVQGNTVVIRLELGPTYSPVEIGEASVSAQRLRILEDQTGVITFIDNGAKAKVRSNYDIVVTDAATGQVMATAQAQNAGGVEGKEQRIVVSSKLSFSRDHAFSITITRSGPKVGAPITFVKSGIRKK